MGPINLLLWLVVAIVAVVFLLYAIDQVTDPPLTAPFRGLLKAVIVVLGLLFFLVRIGVH